MFAARRSKDAGPDQGGQALIEFALVLPIIVFVVLALLEVALALNAYVGINRVSQIGAQLAAVMTSSQYADCVILNEIETKVEVPNRRSSIDYVLIQRTALGGNRAFQEQYYDRTGAGDLTCALGPDPEPATPENEATVTLPYKLGERERAGADPLPPYPHDLRCSVLKGCTFPDDDERTTVDNIGVAVRYRHEWVTPLSVTTEYLPGGNQGWSFTQRNIFRMEPSL